MKEYLVRLRNYDGFILDGEVFTAASEAVALELYKIRCRRLGIQKCEYDYYTVEEWTI